MAHIKLLFFAQIETEIYPNTFLTVSGELQKKSLVFKIKVLYSSLGPAVNVLTSHSSTTGNTRYVSMAAGSSRGKVVLQ